MRNFLAVGFITASPHHRITASPHHRVTASVLVHEFLQARDEKCLLQLQKQLARYRLLIIDELGYVPLSPIGAELLSEVFSLRYLRVSAIVTSNLPLDEWSSTFGSKRLTGALPERLTHPVQILEMNGGGFRLKHSRQSIKARTPNSAPRFVHSPAQLRCSMGARRSAGLCTNLHPKKWRTFAPAKTGKMVHYYSGEWCSFSPALTAFVPPDRNYWSSLMFDVRCSMFDV